MNLIEICVIKEHSDHILKEYLTTVAPLIGHHIIVDDTITLYEVISIIHDYSGISGVDPACVVAIVREVA